VTSMPAIEFANRFRFRNGESGGALIWNCALGRCPTVALIAAGERWRTPVEATALPPGRSWIGRPFPWPKMALGSLVALPVIVCGHPRERSRTALWARELSRAEGSSLRVHRHALEILRERPSLRRADAIEPIVSPVHL
jgi:hypothetical protein